MPLSGRYLRKGFSPAAVLAQPRRDGRKAGDVDAVLGGFADERERVGPLAHAGQGPQQRRAGSAAAMRHDRRRSIPHHCGKGVDIGARQCGGGDRDVVVSDPVPLGNAPRLGGGKLPGVFAIGAIVDDRAHAGCGERIDSARSSLPATLTPGANANSWADMPVLRDDLRAASQPLAAASPKKSGGELRRALHKVASADPEPLQAAERGVGALQVF